MAELQLIREVLTNGDYGLMDADLIQKVDQGYFDR
jgi:hypothetical protein